MDRDRQFAVDADHESFRQVIRSFVEEHLVPVVRSSEAQHAFPPHLWAALGSAGFLGIGHPEDDGGSGGDLLARVLLAEELARASTGLAVTPLVSAYMAGEQIAQFGTKAQRAEFLRPIVAGTFVASIAVSEPGAGSDVAAMTTRAIPAEGGFVLRGAKMFITNAGLADVIVAAAKTDPDAGRRGITMFLVERGSPGLVIGPPLAKMGWHSSDTREVFFDDCFVHEGRVLGERGRGFNQIMTTFESERVLVAGMAVGLAQVTFDQSRSYATQRSAFGRPLARHQAIGHRLAEMLTAVAAARLMTYAAAEQIDRGCDSSRAAAMAKLFACRVANEVVDQAVQIHGGYGFMEESPVAMHYRDARVLRIGGGTDEIQLEILARSIAY